MDINELIRLRDEVAECRKGNVQVNAEWQALYDTFLAEHEDIIAAKKRAADLLALCENALRSAILSHYAETQDKAPAPGLGVRVTEKLVYEPAKALAWAKEHGMCLALDARAFEKVAKAAPPEFVKVEQVPVATIATDLGAVAAPKGGAS